MSEILRTRTIRPSSRKATSLSYKVDVKKVLASDTLVVMVNHESKPFNKTYYFKGEDLASKKSISFRVYDYGTHIELTFSSARPYKQK